MPKATTTSLQNAICKIGADLGFESSVETTLLPANNYSPRYAPICQGLGCLGRGGRRALLGRVGVR